MISLLVKVFALLLLAYFLAFLVANAATPANAVTPSYRAITLQQQVKQAALAHGYTPKQVACIARLIERESKWSPLARNKKSTASGLYQHLRSPSGVMMNTLSVDQQNARAWRYFAHRYHNNPCLALRLQIARGWY